MGLSGVDLGWTSEASVVVAVRDTYCIMLAIFVWNQSRSFSWFKQESQARPSREAGQLSGEEFRLGVGLVPGPAACNRENPAQP